MFSRRRGRTHRRLSSPADARLQQDLALDASHVRFQQIIVEQADVRFPEQLAFGDFVPGTALRFEILDIGLKGGAALLHAVFESLPAPPRLPHEMKEKIARIPARNSGLRRSSGTLVLFHYKPAGNRSQFFPIYRTAFLWKNHLYPNPPRVCNPNVLLSR
jgi:hypothetical protein